MSDRLEFDGDVIVITGGAGGLGKSQALELGRRGARVVVNDLGGSPLGGGKDASLAQAVADEIVAAGGEAIANSIDVSSEDGPDELVQAAVDQWGRLDGFMSNAAVLRNQHFEDITDDDWDTVMNVDLRAVFRGMRSAYTVMKTQKTGGRLCVMTSSSGINGAFGQANYAAAKTGIIGLMKTIAWEGHQYGILANMVAPGAMGTRASVVTFNDKNPAYIDRPPELAVDLDSLRGPEGSSTPEKVTPIVLRLLHRSCPVTAQIFAASSGIFHRFALVATEPYLFTTTPTLEDVVDHWSDVSGEHFTHETDAEALMWGPAHYAPAYARAYGG